MAKFPENFDREGEYVEELLVLECLNERNGRKFSRCMIKILRSDVGMEGRVIFTFCIE
jgi:hypothetical protein